MTDPDFIPDQVERHEPTSRFMITLSDSLTGAAKVITVDASNYNIAEEMAWLVAKQGNYTRYTIKEVK